MLFIIFSDPALLWIIYGFQIMSLKDGNKKATGETEDLCLGKI